MLSPARNLFVLSHMRSYSTVLSHILGSHAEVDGYCETHLKYRSRLDLLRLRWRVRRLTGARLRGRYVLDKILHDYPLPDSVLRHDRTRAIFLLRRPRDAVRSIVSMGGRLNLVAWHQEPLAVADYYERRLSSLVAAGARLQGRALLIESELLTSAPDPELGRIADFLRLEAPLRHAYRHFPRTGQPGFGDPFEIAGRHTLDERTPTTAAAPLPFPLPQERLQRLDDAYARAVETLSRYCAVPGPRRSDGLSRRFTATQSS